MNMDAGKHWPAAQKPKASPYADSPSVQVVLLHDNSNSLSEYGTENPEFLLSRRVQVLSPENPCPYRCTVIAKDQASHTHNWGSRLGF